MSTDRGHGVHRQSIGSSRGMLQEVEKEYRESLLRGSGRTSDTGASITLPEVEARTGGNTVQEYEN